MTAYGAEGYLATITSASENTFVTSRLSDDGWMGAGDADEEGVWKWVTGPEAGTVFWTEEEGTLEGEFSNWGMGQPDNDGENGEQCGQIRVGEENDWNDLPCGHKLDYFIVEYGDDEGNMPDVPFLQISITVVGETIEVSTCEELQAVDDGENSQFATIELTNDIDCEGIEFESLFRDTGFEGTFDGKYHTISNLNINEPEESDVGLIARTYEGAHLLKVNLKGGSVSGEDNVGALAGRTMGTNIEFNTSDIDVSGNYNIGGLVGDYEADDGVIAYLRDSSSSGDVTGLEDVGGLVGTLGAWDEGAVTVARVFATGNVTATEWGDVGGLFGYVGIYSETNNTDDDTVLLIHDVYAQANVVSEQYSAGGLIGYLEIENDGADYPVEFTLTRAYASGDVTSSTEAGGLIGIYETPDSAGQSVVISDVFAAGKVTATDPEGYAGGLAGWLSLNSGGTMIDSKLFFDQDRTGQEFCSHVEEDGPGFNDCTAVNTDGSEPDYFFRATNQPLDEWGSQLGWIMHAHTYPTFGELESESNEPEDLNGDGIPDGEQTNISGYTNTLTGKKVVLDVGEGCEIAADDMVRESNFNVQDPGYDYENGLFDFTLDCGNPGFTTTIKLYYYNVSINGLIVRKHNPITNAYFNLTGAYGATLEQTTIHGQPVAVATYQITDGGDLDIDGEVNGQASDPVGLASSAVGVPNTGGGGVMALFLR